MLKEISQSPILNLLSGLILLVTSAYEIIITADETLIGVSLGILAFSIIHVIKIIPEIVRGLEEIEVAEDMIKR
jgi:ABC-type uncharacterized transport system permease subunit